MFHNLISSQAVRSGHLGVATLSLATHVGLIAAAAVSSGTSRQYAIGARSNLEEHVAFTVSTAMPVGSGAASRHSATRRLDRSKLPRLVVPNLSALQPPDISQIAVPVTFSEADWDALATSSIVFGDSGTSLVERGALAPRPEVPGKPGVYSEAVVERSVFPRPGNPTPAYPRSLEAAGIEGSFFVDFVVGSDGRVEARSLQFPSTAREAFVDAVRRVLVRSRYFPAELAGRRVRQLVRQQFIFRIDQR